MKKIWYALEIGEILKKNRINPKGIIHIGGHRGQELQYYRKHFKNILFIEANPEIAEELKKIHPETLAYAITSSEKKELYIPRSSERASLLQSKEYPAERKIETIPKKLSEIQDPKYNCLALDIQGSELDAMQSGDLSQFDLIICEASRKPRYENACSYQEIKEHLQGEGFQITEKYQHGNQDIFDCIFRKKKS